MRVKSFSFACVIILVGVVSILAGCGNGNQAMKQHKDPSRQVERDWMVDTQIVRGENTDQRVVVAMRRVPRHSFMPDNVSEGAYGDSQLSIGHKQTISKPFIVAYISQPLKAAGVQTTKPDPRWSHALRGIGKLNV